MTNDLISRKEALDLIRNIAYSRELSTFECKFYEDIYNGIDKIPTAYDVDAVYEQMDKTSDYYETDEQGKEHVRMLNLTDAIEIARNGEK